MTYHDIQSKLELLEDDMTAEVITAELVSEVKKRTGRRPRYREQAPVWASEFLRRKGYRI